MWVQVPVAGPSARSNFAMAFDAARGRVVLFGGFAGGLRGDTWEWTGHEWVQAGGPGPSARLQVQMAFDASRDRLVMFGGFHSGPVLSDETWERDAGGTWHQRFPAQSPAARGGYAIAFDPVRAQTVLFGGYPFLRDTWAWDGTNWAQAATTGPSTREDAAMAFDPVREEIVLFSGFNAPPDTWAWTGAAWGALSTLGAPAPRYFHRMATDIAGQRVFMHGGERIGEPLLGDLWMRDKGQWTFVTSDGPGPRSRHGLAWDEVRGCLVLFGGWNGSQRRGDTWLYTDGPFVLERVASASACPGGTVELAAPAGGPGPLTFQWEREQTPGMWAAVTDGVMPGGAVVSGAATDTLLIQGATTGEGGNYRCRVENPCRGVVSSEARVKIGPPADLTTGAVPGMPGYGQPDGVVNNEDFFYYLAQFAAGNLAVADLTAGAVPGQAGYGVPNGVLNNEDFFYYLAIFAAGC